MTAEMELGFALVRVALGLSVASHGAQKLFGWFGGHGINGTADYMESLGIQPKRGFAIMAGLGEFCGGLLVALGLLGPVGPALVVAIMTGAIFTQHLGHGFFNTQGGMEMPLSYALGSMFSAFHGPGPYSLDAAMGITSWQPSYVWSALVLGLLASIFALLMRHVPGSEHTAGAQ